MKPEMMNVLFYIIKTRTLKNGEAPILLRVTIDGSYRDIRINRSVKEEQCGLEGDYNKLSNNFISINVASLK